MRQNSSVKCAVIAACGFACAIGAQAHGQTADPFADSVVGYTPGDGVGAGFDDPTAALGEPTRVTSPDSSFGGAVTPFQSAFGTDELVTVGRGGQLTVAFDEPVRNDPGNPFGIDLLVFGNAAFSDNDFPNGIVGGIFAEGGTVSVSADGVNFFEIAGAAADGAFPTNGFTDPSAPFTTGGVVATGTIPSDFTKPVDPSFDPAGLTLADILAAYDGSGGGVGIDIGTVGLSEISFVRITNAIDAAGTPEIDGFADVAVPTPGAASLLAGAGILAMRRRRARG